MGIFIPNTGLQMNMNDFGVVNGVVSNLETFSRYLANGTNGTPMSASGTIHLTFFRAKYTMTATKFYSYTGGTAAGATPTLARIGLYTVPEDWTTQLTCVAATANTTTLWNGTFQVQQPAFSTATVGGNAMPASYTLVQGGLYALANVIVTAAAVPGFYVNQSIPGNLAAAPRIAAAYTGQTDLTFNITHGSLATSTAGIWAGLAV